MLESLLKNWWILLLKGIVIVILSVYIFLNPDVAVLGLSLFIGIALLISGVFTSIASISYRKVVNNWKWYLVEGLVDSLLGLIILSAPDLTAKLVAFVVGLWFLFYGVTKIVASFELRKNEIDKIISSPVDTNFNSLLPKGISQITLNSIIEVIEKYGMQNVVLLDLKKDLLLQTRY